MDSTWCIFVQLQEFDSSYGPAWHCIVGTSFGSYVTHSLGGFLYFSIDKVYILLFKTAVEPLDHWRIWGVWVLHVSMSLNVKLETATFIKFLRSLFFSFSCYVDEFTSLLFLLIHCMIFFMAYLVKILMQQQVLARPF